MNENQMMAAVKALHAARTALMNKQPLTREERAALLREMPSHEFQKASADLTALDSEVRPSGVVAVLLPSVMGFRYFCQVTAPALAAGNSVVVKPSSKDPKTAEQIKKVIEGNKWPSGTLQVIDGAGSDVGELLASHPSVRAVYLMGKLETGQRVMELALPTMKKLHLGLGYNNSALLLKDLTPKESALLAQACFEDDGKNPYNMTKIFVLESQMPAFLETWIPEAKKYQKSMTGLESVLAILKKSRSKILLGDEGTAPVVSLDLSHCSDLQQECLRLPVVVVAGVKYAHEMIRWANTAYYGHSAIVFANPEKAEAIARKLEVGTVFINTWISEQNLKTELHPGVKQSFYGDLDLRVNGSFLTDRQNLVGNSSES